ncbi:hypothetical protein KOW79_003866 [Hemibagrus wyckioides]|uniref:Uncharacterized protein n=1 Tax=Hemibagrus wyckioides TaxID=337641 RepID=A0A9D3SPU1_9TELE|nr:hypothetical protein KOW79_003866 [Hemibagrus wyckioides]
MRRPLAVGLHKAARAESLVVEETEEEEEDKEKAFRDSVCPVAVGYGLCEKHRGKERKLPSTLIFSLDR